MGIPNFDNKQMRTLEQVEADQRKLADEIAEIREAKTHEPWEPKGGDWTYEGISCITHGSSTDCSENAKCGCSFKTKEAAIKASKFFTFYQRLYQLALACNAKHGTMSTRFRPVQDSWGKWAYYSYETTSRRSTELLFTSTGSIKEACDIMNRDQWIMPTI